MKLRAPPPSSFSCLRGFHVLAYFSGGNPLSCAPVCLVDVVLDVPAADAPHAPTAKLESPKFSRPDEALNKALLHVQLIGNLRQC